MTVEYKIKFFVSIDIFSLSLGTFLIQGCVLVYTVVPAIDAVNIAEAR